MKSQRARIELKSVIDGNEAFYSYEGEYLKKGDNNCLVYTDYTGNAITKVAIEASNTMMLLHRVGGITADMLFDPTTETVVKYDALTLRHGFLLRTDVYKISQETDRLTIYVKYSLNDGSDQPEITGIQEMTIKTMEGETHEEGL